jgi:drug/metabolite transporter (DMT)-like permease
MALSIGITAGLVAMLCWGIADFVQALIVKKIGTEKSFLMSGLGGLFLSLILFLGYLKFGGSIPLNNTLLGILLVASLIQTFGSYFFFRAFEKGEVSIVAPISGTYSLITVVLAVLFLGEILSLVKVIAIAFIIIGVMLVSTDISKLRHLHSVNGVKEVLLSCSGESIFSS